MIGPSIDRRRSPWRRVLLALAVVLVGVSGSDHVVIPSLGAEIHASDLSDPGEDLGGVEDYCRVRRDPLADLGSARRTVTFASPPRDAAARPHGPACDRSPNAPVIPTEHVPQLGLRARSPG